MDSNSSANFDLLFDPQTIAVFGSVKSNKIAHQLITQLSGGGYPGSILAVNPKGERPEGFPAIPGFPQVEALPRRPDLALICVPERFVAEVLESCGQAGVPFAVVFTSGFSESGNTEQELRLKAAAERHGLRLIGPNCAGIMDTRSALFASIEVRALPGKTAFITQSGAVGGAVLALAESRGIGFSKFISYGNRVDIGEVELLDYLVTDPATEVIALYLESLQNGRELLRTIARVSLSKPVIIIKAGRSRSGLRAAGSHTGSMAGSDEIFAAMIRQSGAIRVAGIEQMLDLCDGFSNLPPMRGARIAVVTNSGGPGILASDRAEELGLEVRESEKALKDQLKDFLPEHCAFTNPIDLTVEGTREGYRRTLEAVLDSEYDAAIVINVATPFLDSSDLACGIAEASAGRKHPKPVAAVFMAGAIVERGIETLKRNGIPAFPTGERAAAVLSGMHTYTRARRILSGRTILPNTNRGGAVAPAQGPVLEPEVLSFLEPLGFTFPQHRFIIEEDQIPEATAELGYPLVMKVVSPQILHKSDVGGVLLNLEDEQHVRRGFTDMAGRFADREFHGAMLYTQVREGLEIIAGIKQDPTFGPVVLVGAGGVLTELLQDSALRIAPFDVREAEDMISELRVARLLSGYRGAPALDRRALVDLLLRLSDLAARYPSIRELDFNPVFVQPRGVKIADARIILKER